MPAVVSIGMPLHNAERHLAEALDSLIAQDYENLELIISDNASSDGTGAICRAYAARDKRIRYHRADINHGAVWNFNRVLELATGEYFMWAAHDDTRAPSFVSVCVAALEARPDAVLCCTGVGFIDQDSHRVEPWFELVPPVGTTYRARVSAIARARFWLDFYGLIRRNALAQARPAQPVWGFDVAVALELCLRGQVLWVPEPLFHYRVNRQKTTELVASTLGSKEGFGAVPVNWSAMTLELARSIWHAPLSGLHRAVLIAQLVVQLCIFNGLVGSGIRNDVRANLAAAWADHRFGRIAAFITMAVLVFPVQNGLVRGAYRHVRPPKRTSETPV
ncbi:MAG: glycosyltransferase family 2 protein [Candidatus Dormibacteraceae bacterium]